MLQHSLLIGASFKIRGKISSLFLSPLLCLSPAFLFDQVSGPSIFLLQARPLKYAMTQPEKRW
jgi:hypothetical protein